MEAQGECCVVHLPHVLHVFFDDCGGVEGQEKILGMGQLKQKKSRMYAGGFPFFVQIQRGRNSAGSKVYEQTIQG
jgi:hypothetical protein